VKPFKLKRIENPDVPPNWRVETMKLTKEGDGVIYNDWLTLHGFAAYGGKSLHAQSHGEAFLALLTHRLQGGGLYLFDEPEAALSPQRQLAVLTLLHRLVYHRSQLIIATHSPILLSYPHARIFEFSEQGIKETTYTETEHFRVTRDFLHHHERMLDLLLGEEEADLIARER
jgi:predicted ATPase